MIAVWSNLCLWSKDGDLVALVQLHDPVLGAGIRFVSLRLKGMLRMLMSSRVGFTCWISKGMLRLMLLLIFGRRHQSEMLMDARRKLLGGS